MKTHRPDPDPWLDVLYSEEELRDLEAKSIELMLASARRRQARRRFMNTTVWSLAAGLALTLLWFQLPPHPRPTPSALAKNQGQPSTALSAARPAQASTAGVKILSDAELLALFPNRPVAIIGTSTGQKLVFLDELPVGKL
jgi:hypothetical protein